MVVTLDKLSKRLTDACDLLDLADEEDDLDTATSVQKDVAEAEAQLADLEFRRMFAGEMDANNAFLDIQAGSGGTEAQDWAEMLLRMYLRWGERRGFNPELLEASSGEVAGIKSATVKFTGEYAFGWLRTETGVHRLVRKSPFDSSNRRHTSFSSVFVSPEIDDNIEIDINPADLRTDTYRASGAGGQHVNKTDSAVRITHMPSGIVVTSSEKSQHENRRKAMANLKAKLYDTQRQALDNARSDARKSQVGSGDRSERIRTYNYPQGRVSDHRINLTLYNLPKIMEGEALDDVINPLIAEDQAARLATLEDEFG